MADDRSSRYDVTVRRLVVALGAIVAVLGCRVPVRQRPALGEQAIADRVAEYGPAARARLAPFFAAAGIAYPPEHFVLLGFKLERGLQLLAAGSGLDLTFIRSYPILGMSGTLGPKLREGDGQVPEGIYTIVYLNPDSVAHLSLALSYPNDYDRARAAEGGRDRLGGDIMIHGGATSSGCLAMGDEAAEELFVLAAESGFEGAVVVLSPVDFRRSILPADYRPQVDWVWDLYVRLRAELEELPVGSADRGRLGSLRVTRSLDFPSHEEPRAVRRELLVFPQEAVLARGRGESATGVSRAPDQPLPWCPVTVAASP